MKGTGTQLISILVDTLPAVCIALFGGACEMALLSEDKKISVKFIISSLIVAGFVGMTTALILYDRNISPALQGAVAGIAGASSRSVMELLKKYVLNKIRWVTGDD